MERRNQFTFYRSFWDAVKELSEADRLVVLEGIIRYALDGEAPNPALPYHRSLFTLCQPVLDTARKKAKAMKSMRENSEDADREIENELENEKETEKEREGKPDFPDRGESGFESFWHLYPRKEGKQKAKEAYIKRQVGLGVILDALGRQVSSEQWNREGGRFIPLPATWLNQRRWEDEPVQSYQGRRPDRQEIEAVRRLMQDV